MKYITCSIFIALMFSTSAQAFCRDPGRAPEPPRSYDKPRQPTCMKNAGYGVEPECDQHELDRYQRETDRYIQKLQEFAEDSERYAQQAAAFAQCEIQESRENLRG